MSKPSRLGYMCLNDFYHELGEASGPTRVYPSEEDLRLNRSCVTQCGIVKVKVTLMEVVKESDYSSVMEEFIPGEEP